MPFWSLGTTDLQVSTDDARSLAASRPDARLVLIEGINHVLRQAPPERAANLAAYADPDLPLAPELAAAIGTFFKRYAFNTLSVTVAISRSDLPTVLSAHSMA